MYVTERAGEKIIIYELNTNCDARHVFSNLFPTSPFLSPLLFFSLYFIFLYFSSLLFISTLRHSIFFLSPSFFPLLWFLLSKFPFSFARFHASSHLITSKTFHYCVLFISLTLFFFIFNHLFFPSHVYILLLQFPSLLLRFSFIQAFSVSFRSCGVPYWHLSIEYIKYT